VRAALRTLCCWLALAASAHADSAPLPSEVTWSGLLELARTRSPRVLALRSQGKVAERGIAVARVLPNPSLSYTGFGRIGNGPQYGTQHQLGIEQPLLIGGQRGAREHAARDRASAARAEIIVAELELEAAALQSFIALLAAQARVEELSAAHADVDRVSHTVHESVHAGAEAQYDASRVELESAQLDTRLAQAMAEVSAASASLAATIGLPGWQPRARGELAPLGVTDDFARLWQSARHALPALRLAERQSWAARSEIEVARAERWGVPSVSAGTLLTTSGGSAAAFVGLSAPLPVFDFGGAAIDRAAAGLSAAEASRSAIEANAQAVLGGALESLRARRAALATYDRGVGDRVPELRQMAEMAYRSGTASLLELLDSVRAAIDVKLERVELVAQVMAAELDVLVASGTPQLNLPAPAPAPPPSR